MEKTKTIYNVKSYKISISITQKSHLQDGEEDFISLELCDVNSFSVYYKDFLFTNLVDADVNWKRCFDLQGVLEVLETIFTLENNVDIEILKEKCKISFEYGFIKSKYKLTMFLPIIEQSLSDVKFHMMKIFEKFREDSESKILLIEKFREDSESKIRHIEKFQEDSESKIQHFEKFRDDSESKIQQIEKINQKLEKKNQEIENKNQLLEKKSQEIENANQILEKKNLEMEANQKIQTTRTTLLENKINEYQLKLIEIQEDIFKLKNCKLPLYSSYKISDKKLFTILHYSNQDCYSPTSDVLIKSASSIGVKFNILEERKQKGIVQSNIDAILVSIWSATDPVTLGSELQNYINAGVNVVIVLFGNSTTYQPPKSDYINFIEIKGDDGNGSKTWKKIINNHILFEGNPSVTVGSDKRRAIFGKILYGSIDVVAEWEDSVPMMIVRKDTPALITQLGFQCGNVGSQDGLRVVINALRMINC